MNRPNFLFLISDQHRADCLGVEGNRVIETPSMDSIAWEGARFSRAYSACPSCIAARRSILSGQFAATHGMTGYRDDVQWDPPTTLPAELRKAGYHTIWVGRSIHQYPVRKRYGFDHMVCHEDYERWSMEKQPYFDFERRHLTNYGVMNNDWTVHPWTREESLHFDNWSTTEGLRARRDRDPSCPLFLAVSYLAPHPPFQPPQFYFDRYMRRDLPMPTVGDWAHRPENDGVGLNVSGMVVNGFECQYPYQTVLEGDRAKETIAGYYAAINHIDSQINRLLSGLNGFNRRNTCVIYVSDHGELLGDHHLWRKYLPYEGSARIPFLVRLPDNMNPKRRIVCDSVVCLEDLMPTILDIAGVDIPDTCEGESLLPILKGERNHTLRESLHMEHAENMQAIVTKEWKYVYFTNTGDEQLFDMLNDPKELHNAIGDYPEQARKMRAQLIDTLRDRPEGFVRDGDLVKNLRWSVPG